MRSLSAQTAITESHHGVHGWMHTVRAVPVTEKRFAEGCTACSPCHHESSSEFCRRNGMKIVMSAYAVIARGRLFVNLNRR